MEGLFTRMAGQEPNPCPFCDSQFRRCHEDRDDGRTYCAVTGHEVYCVDCGDVFAVDAENDPLCAGCIQARAEDRENAMVDAAQEQYERNLERWAEGKLR